MLFDTLQIPESLLVAQQEGRLVVFGGAGVSVGRPSGLPNFLDLTAQIAQRPLTRREKLRADHLLGEMKEAGIDVHAEAASILGRQSRPTQLHEDLIRLFPSRECVRVVTTNFDRHFRAVANRIYPGLPVFTAPALPRGGDFNGLVEIHGSIGAAIDMVVTDRDFGRAYLTEGWARMFVEHMFRNYVLLFVGYSLTDPPMHYLARGLPTEKESRRFAITNEDPARWKALGVGVVPYKARRGQQTHAPLRHGIASWVQITRGSNFWLEERIVSILERPDPAALASTDAELLIWSLGQDYTANYFVRNARGMRWVEWLAGRGMLRPYFDARTNFEHARQRQIAIWLADRLIAGPKDRAIGIVHTHGGQLSSELFRWLRFAMDKEGAPIEWTLLLASQVHASDTDAHFDLGMRVSTLAHEGSLAFWPLWSDLVTPVIEFDWNELESARDAHAQVAVKGMAADLWLAWRDGIRPNFHRLGRYMLSLLLGKWEQACDLARGLDGTAGLEALHRRATSWRQRIFTTHSDGHRGHRPTVLVDMLVNLVGYFAERSGELTLAQISVWLDSDDSVLRRIGLHALSQSADVSTPAKVSSLRIRLDLYPQTSPEHLESGLLLAEFTAPTTSSALRHSEAALPPPTSESLPPIAEMLAMEREQLVQRLRFVRWTQTEVLWALTELDGTTEAAPTLISHPLWTRLLQSSVWRELDATGRDSLLAIIRRRGLIPRYPDAVVRALFHADPLAAEGTATVSSFQAEELFSAARELWSVLALGDEPEDQPDYARVDWVSSALNHGVYHLVQFWFRYLSIQPVNPADLVLPLQLLEVFDDVIARSTSTGRRARAVLVQDIGYLVVRAPRWTLERVIPLFDFGAYGNDAWVAWRALLDHGGANRPLALAIIPAYRAARSQILTADERQIEEYLRNVAGMMVYVQTAEAVGWQGELLPMLPEAERRRWGRLVGRELPMLTDEQQMALWEGWLHDYWSQRRLGRLGLHSMPLTGGEASIMAGWLPSLPTVFPDAFALVSDGTEFDFDNERFDWRELRQSSVPVRHPAEFLAFLEFLLARMPEARVHHDSIKETLGRIPRLAVFRAPLLRISEVFQRHAWIEAKAFREWVERELPELT